MNITQQLVQAGLISAAQANLSKKTPGQLRAIRDKLIRDKLNGSLTAQEDLLEVVAELRKR